MNTNLSTLDRYVRMVGGILLVGSAMSMRKSMMKQAVMAVGAMKIAEGAIGWCPIMHMAGVRNTRTAVQLGESNESQHAQQRDNSNHANPRTQTAPEYKEGVQMDTPMERQENSPGHPTLSPIEAHRVLEGSDALNTAYQ